MQRGCIFFPSEADCRVPALCHQEIRLELDDSKLKTIITELDILHRATSPFIVDFYGAFFIESCVYYCMEFMDAGSLDFFAGCDLPEDVFARITRSMVEGLKFLKDELKIMHRDVKPTNVLLNLKGYVKLCDFGVSGQLDRSLAKTNIGCQSYMAVSARAPALHTCCCTSRLFRFPRQSH